jgi:predicted permease
VDRSNPAAGLPRAPVPYEDFLVWRSRQTSFEHLVAWFGGSVGIVGDGVPPGHYNGAWVTADLFDAVGVRPRLGRGLLPEDGRPDAPPVAVISDRVWREMFGGDPGIPGRPIRINGEIRTVTGVMPAGFEFPLRQDLWLPLRVDESAAGIPFLQVFGKLRGGISLRQARAEMSAIAERLARERPETHAGFGALLSRYTHGYTDEGLRRSQELLLAAVAAVLLIACVNAASLLLVESTRRRGEMAVRTALGASRRRLVAQLLTEAGLLVAAGGLAGLLVARWAVDAYLRLFGELVSNFWMAVRLDAVAFGVAAGVSGLAVLLAGLPAALLGSSARPAEVLKQGGRTSRLGRVYRALSVVEIALSFALLAATGLMIRSVLNLGRLDWGASPDKVLVATVSLQGPRYADREAQLGFFRDLVERIEALPGARTAGVASRLPGDMPEVTPFEIEGRTPPAFETREVVVSPGGFEVLGLKLLEGRVFTAADREGAPAVAVVNRSFARRYFPGASPVGRRVRLGPDRPWMTLVGVVSDMALGGVEGSEHDGIYAPLAQRGGRFMALVVRTESAPLSLERPIRTAVASLDPELSVFWLRSLEESVAEQTLPYRAAAWLFTLFGALALFLAVVGLYEVMALTLRQRSREIGIRAALGAGPRRIRLLILRQGALQVAAGLLLGVALAAAGLRLVAGFLFGVEVWNVPVLLGAGGAVAAAGLLACLPPAIQAARLLPVTVLKAD